MRGLSGKVALITGAARGQGLAVARRLACEGCRVLLGDRLAEENAAAAAGIGAAAIPIALDVTDPGDWNDAVGIARERFGRLDILVNNAGIVRKTPLDGGPADDYLAVIEVNQVGVFRGTQAVTGLMTESGGGSIVNTSSIDGFTAVAGLSGYVSSKFAIRGLTKVAALELADRGIRVNSVHPGYVDTAMLSGAGMGSGALSRCGAQIPLGRVGTADDIADAVAFLASPESSYCTGSELVIDGGLIAGRKLGGEGLD